MHKTAKSLLTSRFYYAKIFKNTIILSEGTNGLKKIFIGILPENYKEKLTDEEKTLDK